MADVRRDKAGVTAIKKPTPRKKTYGKLNEDQLKRIARLADLIEHDQVRLNAMTLLWQTLLKELKEEYDLPDSFNIDFKTGALRDA